MPDWDSAQYLRFEQERTQPCHDLVARIQLDNPRTIIDLGCGPGNSTEVVAARWPDARITGLDSSPDMIAKARSKHPDWQWVADDITRWTAGPDRYDLVFSNAALQWTPDHAQLFPALLRHAPVLAVQVPGNWDGLAHRLMRQVGERFGIGGRVREWFVHEPDFYYDALAPHAARVDLWSTEYIHIMDSPEAIVEWYKGTGMRPFLEALDTGDARGAFTAAYLDAVREGFPPRPNGKVLFPFKRLFLIAYG